jgi:hypothetical protein
MKIVNAYQWGDVSVDDADPEDAGVLAVAIRRPEGLFLAADITLREAELLRDALAVALLRYVAPTEKAKP